MLNQFDLLFAPVKKVQTTINFQMSILIGAEGILFDITDVVVEKIHVVAISTLQSDLLMAHWLPLVSFLLTALITLFIWNYYEKQI
ncbi:hypothetical protein BCS96_10570 [Vibrio breoganii]|nr:hypothetical protein BCU81_05095 [Vibrio breoganii]PMO98910.1 hypothetical protein BCS96_10570 [Vibrio breoganii]